LIALGGLLLLAVFALACAFVYLAPALPTAESMHNVELTVPLRVYSRSGALVSQIGEQRRIPVTFEDIPPLVRQAVLSAEDDRFFEHSGLDWMGVVRALVMNVVKAGAGQGGSTITQQAARNMFLTLDKTARRKLSEVFVTYRMEHDFTKEQILATYLNVIYFGQRSYGIAAAAETFYGKKLDQLSVGEVATLAGVIQLPSRYNPVTNPKAAEARRSYVLRRMTELHYIDQATAEAAAKEPISTRRFAPLVDVEAPYVAELVRQQIVARYGEAAVNAGYKVFTTLDDRLQTAANRALRIGLQEYDRRHGYRGPLAKVTLPAAATATDLDELLAKYEAISMLQPAVVTKVADTSATVHIRNGDDAVIRWEGLSWARRAVRTGLGAVPRKAAEVVAPGDVVYVVSDGRGAALLGQLPQAQAALVALDPADGAIVSMVGGFDFYINKFNRVTQAHRQPGSGFKPFLYSAALEHGFTPASIILDMPPVLNDDSDSEENWRPRNSGGEFSGPMRMREALVLSRNYVSIRILQSIGVDAAIEHAVKFGFQKESFPRNFTIALGSQAATPLDMATGFAVFANGGFKVNPYYINRIEDGTGKVLYEAQPLLACAACETPASGPPLVAVAEPAAAAADPSAPAPAIGAAPAPLAAAVLPQVHDVDAPAPLRKLALVQGGPGYLAAARLAPRVVSPQNVWLMTSMMHDVAQRGTARRTRALNRDDLAGKTGTTNRGRDNTDNWFNGFNSRLVATVWVGFDTEQSLGSGEEGSSTAVPIWIHYMREALRSVPSSTLPRPDGLIDLRISPSTGAVVGPDDPDAIYETFMIEHQPQGGAPGEPGNAPGASSSPTQGKGSGEPLF
jgi:penicillin-binding protein 1A